MQGFAVSNPDLGENVSHLHLLRILALRALGLVSSGNGIIQLKTKVLCATLANRHTHMSKISLQRQIIFLAESF